MGKDYSAWRFSQAQAYSSAERTPSMSRWSQVSQRSLPGKAIFVDACGNSVKIPTASTDLVRADPAVNSSEIAGSQPINPDAPHQITPPQCPPSPGSRAGYARLRRAGSARRTLHSCLDGVATGNSPDKWQSLASTAPVIAAAEMLQLHAVPLSAPRQACRTETDRSMPSRSAWICVDEASMCAAKSPTRAGCRNAETGCASPFRLSTPPRCSSRSYLRTSLSTFDAPEMLRGCPTPQRGTVRNADTDLSSCSPACKSFGSSPAIPRGMTDDSPTPSDVEAAIDSMPSPERSMDSPLPLTLELPPEQAVTTADGMCLAYALDLAERTPYEVDKNLDVHGDQLQLTQIPLSDCGDISCSSVSGGATSPFFVRGTDGALSCVADGILQTPIACRSTLEDAGCSNASLLTPVQPSRPEHCRRLRLGSSHEPGSTLAAARDSFKASIGALERSDHFQASVLVELDAISTLV